MIPALQKLLARLDRPVVRVGTLTADMRAAIADMRAAIGDAERDPVASTIRARRVADQLHLSIANSLSGQDPATGGTKVGLANVAERLRARYEGRCAFIAGPQPDGGFAAIIQMPYQATS